MRRVVFVLIVSTMVAAGAASGKQPLLRGQLDKAKNVLLGNKAILGLAATLLVFGMPLTADCADCDAATLATQTSSSDTALQEQIKQEINSSTAILQRIEQKRGRGGVDMYFKFADASLSLNNMRAYDPDFAQTVADGRRALKNIRLAREGLHTREDANIYQRLNRVIDDLEKEFKHRTEGIRGEVRPNINWTVQHTEKNYRIGIDYRDVKHYYEVKDTLTAIDYEGVSIHYLVDGKSYRGVADAIHPELETQVRVGHNIINVAQISGVLISLSQFPTPNHKRVKLDRDKVAEPNDIDSYIPPDETYNEDIAAGAWIEWFGYRQGDSYSDGYGEFRLTKAVIEDRNFPDDPWTWRTSEPIYAFVNYDNIPVPTVIVSSNIVWDIYKNDVFVNAFSDQFDVHGLINDLQLRYYLKVKDGLTASDYRGALVRYRQSGNTFTALVLGADESSEIRAVVVDLATDEEKVIAVADIQGVLQLKHADYSKPATINIDDSSYYGEVFLVFSTGELTALIHATREGDAGIELLNNKYTLTVHREDEGLTLH